MLDLETVKDILVTAKTERKGGCKWILKDASKKLKNIKKLLNTDFCYVSGSDKDIAARWLYDNYPRLEETMKSDKMELCAVTKAEKKSRIPTFFRVFCYAVENSPKMTEIEICNLFDACNGMCTEITIGESRALLPTLSLALCMRICDAFEGVLLNDKKEMCIRELFLTLDALSCFDEDKVLSSNPVELSLKKDPMKLYEKLTPATRSTYRNNLQKCAKHFKSSQKQIAETIVQKCKQNTGNDRHIGKYLCDKPCGGKTYVFLVFFMTLLFTLLLCLVSPVFIVSVIPVYGCSRLLADKFFVRYFVKSFHLPAIKLDAIPDGHGVLTVITSLITGTMADEELFERLENMYHSNGEKNAYFGLLCDLCDSSAEKTKRDEEIIQQAQCRILELRKKYGNSFFFFVRKREYSSAEEKYIAPERKRGAVNALTEFLCEKGDVFCHDSIKPCVEICRNIKYVLTLDADTNMAFDCLRTLTGIMMHPQNVPYADKEKAVVTKGYGILQPSVNTTLQSSGKSFFSSVMCGHGGVDFYASGGSDAVMSMFGRSIFCGKGMFEKNCFYDVLCGENAFVKGRILSHDAPEGARLRCAYVPGVAFTDSFPSEPLSYFKRQHRWIRGDLQNIPFLFRNVKTSGAGKIRNRIPLSSKLFMWNNVYGALVPLFSLISLFLSAFCQKGVSALLVSSALSVYVLPFGYSVFSSAKKTLWHNFRRLFYSNGVYTGIWTSFFRMFFGLCAIPKSASVSLDAIVRCLYRGFVSHKNMLEWTTAAQNDAEKSDGLLGYVKKNLVNAVCGTLLFLISRGGTVRLVALMWLFMPVLSYHSGKRRKTKNPNTDSDDREKIMEYCRDMWHFFYENVGENTNHLPSDNIAVYPERRLSRMTSPTNIGLYLLSVVCVRELGFIDNDELYRRLYECLKTVDGLEKSNGLLYNWYDIFKKEPMMPKYVSSVDLGNYYACLICVKEAVEDFYTDSTECKKIKEMCKKLLFETDLSRMYDYDTNLFYIGGAADRDGLVPDRNKYDMLMSEARILSFCAVAEKLVPAEHIKHLSRRFVQGNGYMGLASWSGTAFEFFMPEIFMPSKQGSLVYEALCFAYSNQRRNGAGHGKNYVFGISESCYNEFDSFSNYKYRAFGVPEIAVDVFEKQNVISPYSSFLFLPMSLKEVLNNLEKMKNMGAYGEYGFYESIDFERCGNNENYAVVRCFMAHHLGMSIAACVNMLCKDRVAKWFLKDEKIKSAFEITEEKIPYDAYVKTTARHKYIQKHKFLHTKKEKAFSEAAVVHINRTLLGIMAKKGKLRIREGKLLLSRAGMFENSLCDFEVCVSVDGQDFYFDKRCRLFSDGGQVKFSKTVSCAAGDRFGMSLYVTLGDNTCETVRMRIILRQLAGDKNKKISFKLSFCPLLDTKENSRVCSFFDSRDIYSETSDEDTEITFKRVSQNKCICTGVVEGKEKRAQMTDETAVLSCNAVSRDGVFVGEFAIAVSDSMLCAKTGLVRCREDSFFKQAEKTAKFIEDEKNTSNNCKKRITGVLGCSVVKASEKHLFPIDSGDKDMHLMSTAWFSSLANDKNLGVSFVCDINQERVTDFMGVREREIQSERLVLCDGFDLCRNSINVSFSNNRAEYRGIYKDVEYKVCAFLPERLPCKIIVVEGLCNMDVKFDFQPSERCGEKRYIGAGLVFFGARNEKRTGFAFGIGSVDNVFFGAEYSLCDRLSVNLLGGGSKKTVRVFCIGKASAEEAAEIYNAVINDYEVIQKNAAKYSESLLINENLLEAETKRILSKFFVFPADNSCKRMFIKGSTELLCFDTLVMMYTSFEGKRECLIKMFSLNLCSCISKLVSCVVLCEYIRITVDKSVLELRIKGESPYKTCLSFLNGMQVPMNERELFVLALSKFSKLCENMGDLRTSLSLKERIKRLEDTDRGIFL